MLASNRSTTSWAQSAAYLAGKIYWIGGCGGNCLSSMANVEIYDIAGNTWSAAAPLPAPIGWSMATAIAPYVYVAGGTVPADVSKTYRYDPAANTWDDAAIADLPGTRWGAASDLLKGKWL